MEPINVVCCLDNSFVMPCGIMLYSLCENNKDVSLCIYVIHADLTEPNKQKLKTTVENFGQHMEFVEIGLASLPNICLSKQQHHLPISTYYRLFMTSLLPEGIRKVLYLDGDIIVRKSIKGLYNLDMQNVSLAAVPDDKYCYDSIGVTYNALKYSPKFGYFNAGVLLINLDYWREVGAEQLFVDFINNHSRVLYHHDQDVLNSIFYKTKLLLPLKYNFMPLFLVKPKFRLISWEYDEEIAKTATDPVIIHYTGLKPWFKDCDHPYKEEFLKYKSMSLWKDAPLSLSFKRELKRSIKDVINKLGISDRFRPVEYAYQYSDLKQ